MNKKIAILLLLCGSLYNVFSQSISNSADDIYVSIPPIKYFVDTITQKTLASISMVPNGKSPELYAPTAKQIFELSNSDVFIGIGLPYEDNLIKSLNHSHPNLITAHIGESIVRIAFDDEEEDHNHSDGDPHIWVSIDNAPILAKDIYHVLLSRYPDKKSIFNQGLAQLLSNIEECQEIIKNMLQPYKGYAFMIYHPVLTYFAHEMDIIQLSIQWKGQERSLKQVKSLITQAKKHNIKLIIIQKGFPDESARALASQINDGDVISINPLQENWIESMFDIADVLLESFSLSRE